MLEKVEEEEELDLYIFTDGGEAVLVHRALPQQGGAHLGVSSIVVSKGAQLL